MRITRIKWFTLGIIACLLVSSFVSPALATVGQRQATLVYRNIKITLDGTEVVPKDVNGNVVEPFIINGTTYLPVRGIASALDLEVDWVSATNTVTIETVDEIPAASNPPPLAAAITLPTGAYTVGNDIPSGRYVVTGEGSGNIIVHNADGSLYINEILSSRDVTSVTADFGDGYKIQIRNMTQATFKPAARSLSTKLTTGHWLVGTDISAGTYDAVPAAGEFGNLIILHDDGRIAHNEALGNGAGVHRVNLQNGQRIQVSGLSSVSFR